MTILVTGAAGFIGSCFIRKALSEKNTVVILDKLTYAGHKENFYNLVDNQNCFFCKGDIADSQIVQQLILTHKPNSILNFAAESHVDNSIHSPREFIETNIVGTFNLLNESLKYWKSLSKSEQSRFRYLQVSTDEVYGTLGETGKFNENYPYQPNSPYSASKASADHLTRAWFHTFKLPTLTTNCSNNYGPRQFPEKLIPLMINNALNENSLPIYGSGDNVRDWIHVEDHCNGIYLALTKGSPGETYCFGGNSERKNIEVVQSVCKILDELRPRPSKQSYSQLITFVSDRAGHDWRYAIDDSKAESQLGFKRKYNRFEDGLKSTIEWYLTNFEWSKSVLNKKG